MLRITTFVLSMPRNLVEVCVWSSVRMFLVSHNVLWFFVESSNKKEMKLWHIFQFVFFCIAVALTNNLRMTFRLNDDGDGGCGSSRVFGCCDVGLFIQFCTLSHNLNNYSSGKFQIYGQYGWHALQWKKWHAEPLSSIVIAINKINIFCSATECCVFFVALLIFFAAIQCERAWFRFYNHYFIRCMLLIARPSIGFNVRSDLRQVNLFVRALMCKPLNNHKIKIIARKMRCEWNERKLLFALELVGDGWRVTVMAKAATDENTENKIFR